MLTTRISPDWYRVFVVRRDGTCGTFFGREYIEATERARHWQAGDAAWAEYNATLQACAA